MIGRKIKHYQITEKLGEGGMGVVYKAHDTKLGRTVALKFLSPQVIDSPEEQQRLVNEARAAAGLHHPNICTIYEINEHEGQTFIAMAYVEGSTLRDKVLSEHIAADDALRYLIQIAEGLKQAHEKDIVHRDIKSANIMVDAAGRAVIMDFGLAKPAGQIRGDERFSSGGTSAYMSPEQARGEGVDQRTDIWSLGVVLYEMLAGQLPFRGDYEQAVIYSILNENPRPVREVRPTVPPHVAAIVERCLAKSPDDRYQTLGALVDALQKALERVTGGTTRQGPRGTRRRAMGMAAAAVLTLAAAFLVADFLGGRNAESEERVPIAVIDFNNQTGEAAMDGLSGMLITALEQSRRLSVMTRTRMFDVLKTLGGENVDRISESTGQEICRAVGVGALVIPSIRKFGDLYTIDLKVLDTRNNKYIFTTKEQGEGAESIPGMIDRIARGIRVDLNEATHEVAATKNVADVTTVNLEAYQSYFEGERYLNDLDFGRAHELFERATYLDSTFALAYYRLAYTEWWSRGRVSDARAHVTYAVSNLDRIPEKERFLVRALEAGLNEGFEAQAPIYREMSRRYPDDKEMLFGLGDSEFHSANYDSAQVHFERVLELDPEFDRALQHLTWTYMRTDQFDRATDVARRWVKVTGSAEAHAGLASALYATDKPDEALAQLETAESIDPRQFTVRQLRADVNFSEGRVEEAVAAMEDLLKTGESGYMRTYAARTLGQSLLPYLGRFRDATELLEQTAMQATTEESDSTYLIHSRLAQASIHYWAYLDVEGCLSRAEATDAFADRFKDEDYWHSRAALYFVAGKEEEGARILESHGGKLGGDARLIYAGLREAGAGRCDAALAAIDSVTGIARENVRGIRVMVGRCFVEGGDYDAAITELRKNLEERSLMLLNSASVVVPTHVLLGRAYEGKGDAVHAEEHYRKALDIWKDGDGDLALATIASARLKALLDAKNM